MIVTMTKRIYSCPKMGFHHTGPTYTHSFVHEIHLPIQYASSSRNLRKMSCFERPYLDGICKHNCLYTTDYILCRHLINTSYKPKKQIQTTMDNSCHYAQSNQQITFSFQTVSRTGNFVQYASISRLNSQPTIQNVFRSIWGKRYLQRAAMEISSFIFHKSFCNRTKD